MMLRSITSVVKLVICDQGADPSGPSSVAGRIAAKSALLETSQSLLVTTFCFVPSDFSIFNNAMKPAGPV